MAPDPIIYCLEQLTDYEQFERLCHDVVALDGYRDLEPLGGSKDKGRDALHADRSSGTATVFAYSVREDWRAKLDEDAEKIKRHDHPCDRLVFLCTASFTAGQRDAAIADVRDDYGWDLEIYGLERLGVLFRTTHRSVLAHHPTIFCPPFFSVAGGLSLSPSFDHVIVDHVDDDAALAHWLARRLTLAGYSVWCRGLAPLAGSSLLETVRGLLENRGFRYICILSPTALADPQFAVRRGIAQAIGSQRGLQLNIPALAAPIDEQTLDSETRRLEPARFDIGWAPALKHVEAVLRSNHCPRAEAGGQALALRSYYPDDIILPESEPLASNVFSVARLPEVIHRFESRKKLPSFDDLDRQWAFRKSDENTYLSFFQPPAELAREYRITGCGGAVWSTIRNLDGLRVDYLVVELLKKSLYAECRRLGLAYCPESRLVYFPTGLFKNDNLRFTSLSGIHTFFSVSGERKWGRDGAYRYHVAPEFHVLRGSDDSWEIALQVRVRVTNADGTIPPGKGVNRRRKKLCKSWWNQQWLNKVVGIAQFLAGGDSNITISDGNRNPLVIEASPRTWTIPIRINEAALGDGGPDDELGIDSHFANCDDDEDDGEEADA